MPIIPARKNRKNEASSRGLYCIGKNIFGSTLLNIYDLVGKCWIKMGQNDIRQVKIQILPTQYHINSTPCSWEDALGLNNGPQTGAEIFRSSGKMRRFFSLCSLTANPVSSLSLDYNHRIINDRMENSIKGRGIRYNLR